MPTTQGRTVWAARAVTASAALFAVLVSASMALYPGGTWCDASTSGHRFWQNFLCDLTWETSLGGAPNHRGAWVARAAMIALSVGLGLTWHLASGAGSGREGARRVLVLAGRVAVVGMIAVTLLPSEAIGRFHGAVVFLAAGPGLVATALSVRLLAVGEARPRAVTATGLAMLLFASVDLALYALHLSRPERCEVALPAIQKVALLLLLQWMLFVASRARHFAKRV